MGNATQVAKSSLASKMGEGKQKRFTFNFFYIKKKIIPRNQIIHLFHGFLPTPSDLRVDMPLFFGKIPTPENTTHVWPSAT